MSMTGMKVKSVTAWADGGWYDYTSEVNFGPKYVLASVALGQLHGVVSADAGIVGYRHRLADGSDPPVPLSDYPFMAPLAFSADKVTAITWGLSVYDCWARAALTITFWS
jgi:hypothetical protein